jgi:uncharacterized membrane protein
MEVFLLIILIIMIIWLGNKVSSKNQQVQDKLDSLHKEFQRIKIDVEKLHPPSGNVPEEKLQKPSFLQEFAPVAPTIKPETTKEPEYVDLPVLDIINSENLIENNAYQDQQPVINPEPQPSFLERFLKNNPDLEKFIGENLMNKIGIAILVLGIGYFVKFAIDKEWINEIGRVFIGVLAGGLLIGVAHRLRNSFAAFSSVLVGGGLAVLYFTIAIAFHQYQILSQTAAFVIMVVITGFSIVLSISYNRVELAVLSIIGGFATPFMLSTGQGNYKVLFTYVLILNIGMLILAYLKKWNIINWICYVFTIILYGGWLTIVLQEKEIPYSGALFFGTLFYVIFFLMNIINNIKERTKFSASEISILLSNTFLFYSAGMLILAEVNEGVYQGLFTAIVAVFNFVFAFILYKNERVDRTLVYLLIGLVITFLSLSIPVQLEGNYITMFWALEAVLLLWLAQKSGLKLVATSAVIVTGLMLISLGIDWDKIYSTYTVANPLPVLLNKAFITSFICIISLFATNRLLNNHTTPFGFYILQLPVQTYRGILAFILGVVIYLAFLLELNHQLLTYIDSQPSRTILLGCYNLLYIVCLFMVAQRRKIPAFSRGISMLGLFGVLMYIIVYNQAVMQLLQNRFLSGAPSSIGFPFHYFSFVCVLIIIGFIFGQKTTFDSWVPMGAKIVLWLMCVALVYIFSSELTFHVLYLNLPVAPVANLNTGPIQPQVYTKFHQVLTQTYKVGFAILWGICAFTAMYIGLKRKNKDLRIIALTLFALTLAKLFIFDIRGISEGGKIAAFISLGILLLIISFMYQNIKKLILADDAGNPPIVNNTYE